MGRPRWPRPPSDVSVRVGTAATSPVVPLAADAKSSGPKAGARFASQPGPYPSGFEGKLEAKVGGGSVAATFLFR